MSPESTNATSPTLVAGLRRRDDSAFERLALLYGPSVLRWARGAGLGDDDAHDVLQEVLHTVSRRLDTFRHGARAGSLRAWLRVVTRSKVVDLYRRRAREPEARGGSTFWRHLPDPRGSDSRGAEPRAGSAPSRSSEGSARAGAACVDEPTRALLARALAALDGQVHARTLRAFWATAVEGRRVADVAVELELTAGAVRVAKCRVLQRLRASLAAPPRT